MSIGVLQVTLPTSKLSSLSCLSEEGHHDILASPVEVKRYALVGDLRYRSAPDLHSRSYKIAPAIGIFDQALKLTFAHLNHSYQLKL